MSIYELDITDFFRDACAADYSASAMELGQDAGKITWQAACDDSSDWQLLRTDEERAQFRRYVKGFGAWDEEEIAAWSDTELNALCIQFVSGDIRELEALCANDDPDDDERIDFAKAEELAERGTISGRIGPGTDGRIYYSISE